MSNGLKTIVGHFSLFSVFICVAGLLRVIIITMIALLLLRICGDDSQDRSIFVGVFVVYSALAGMIRTILIQH